MEDNDVGADQQDLELIEQKVLAAGAIAMGFFKATNRVWTKEGDSPVSEADLAVDRYLFRELLAARPEFGWLSEETADSPQRLDRAHVFVVDPIDGTRGFVRGDPDWCISVAVVTDRFPRVAVLHCPARRQVFTAIRGHGAFLNGERLSGSPRKSVERLSGSRRINDALRRQFPQRFELHPFLPSLACRLALVATGDLDGAFAAAGSHEWDVAAADLILLEAGGRLATVDGSTLDYNKVRAGMPALVASSVHHHEQVLDLAKSGGFLR